MLGLVKISSSLARVEERLQVLVNEYVTTSIQNIGNKQQQQQQYLSVKPNSKISNHMSWIVKMWHFGHMPLPVIQARSLIYAGRYLECLSSYLSPKN